MGHRHQPDDIQRFVDEDAETYIAMGFTQFTLGFDGPSWDVAAGARFLEWRDERDPMTTVSAEPATRVTRCLAESR